jgi:hypothetical protein
MTTINVDTSPLQAAREWRGIGLVQAALTSGMPVAQAEALESGDPDAFTTIDEMIASAVVYGASLGIGRDEAVALLDRTVSHQGARVELPDAPRPGSEFSTAVRERSARIAPIADSVLQVDAFATLAAHDEPALSFAPDSIEDVIEYDAPPLPSELLASFPDVPAAVSSYAEPLVHEGPSPEQAMAASSEIHVGHELDGEAPWDRSGGDYTGELEAWAAEAGDEELYAAPQPGRFGVAMERVAAGSYAVTERVLGSDRADAVADAFGRVFGRVGKVARTGREQMRRSEHATLIVAIGGGAILIALVVAIGGALGGSDTKAPTAARTTPKVESPGAAGTSVKAAPAAGTPAVAKPVPVLAPNMLNVDVYNAGSKKGYAKEVGDRLKGLGYQVGAVENAGGKFPGATVIYPKGMDREARILARRTGITTLQVAPGTGKRITLVVT